MLQAGNLVWDWFQLARERVLGPILLTLGAQGLVLLGAVFIVVIRPALEAEPEFQGRKTIYLPQRELEHRAAFAEFQELAQAPSLPQALSVDALQPQNLPALPQMPGMESLPTAEMPLASATALLGQTGLLGGLGAVVGESSELSFFGLQARAERIVICFDISGSVKNKVERAGYSMEAVRQEAIRVLEGLNANTLFGFIQFSRNYDFFRDYLVAGTKPNKRAALQWLETEFRTNGSSGSGWRREEPNGIESVLAAAFRLDPAPDMIVILSDGSFQRSTERGGSQNVPWRALSAVLEEHQAVLPRPAQINFVGFQMKEADRSALRRIVRRYGGQLREVDGAGSARAR